MGNVEAGAEVAALLACLASQRRHVLDALEGLDDEALRRGVLPSGWNCLGLVRHLALDVEQFWFRGALAGEPEVIEWALAEHEEPWEVGPGVPAADVLALYRRQIALADAVVEGLAPDAAPAWWPTEIFGPPHLHSVREVVLHVITETACHAGHLDAVRELIDGRQRLVLT
ncbi:DinB family protein [Streptomyces sp. NPDC020917]|uniref:DinB family protein n=1 Tax=Streptomyces sp. NPDC020917 TaxID=3365102 RepID=UPI0037B01787